MSVSALPIATSRLALRDLEPGDWDAVHRYASDPLVTRYLAWDPNAPEDTTRFLDLVRRSAAEVPRWSFQLGIVERASGELIGGCGLLPHRVPPREYEIGYCLRPDRWGQGVGAEAVRALLGFGFQTMNAGRIYGLVDPENRASVRLLTRLGFRLEARRRRAVWKHGAWRDALQYVMHAEAWAAATFDGGAC